VYPTSRVIVISELSKTLYGYNIIMSMIWTTLLKIANINQCEKNSKIKYNIHY